ncbi:GNAT family N-acetyltransferase [Vallitalea okinawensis]|uniref:GNAT family N-acetyltransferase n=1 Tax=Vallitalea okinawensis TaxID=2078660 RepID=UPI000CFD743B|nr:GNAT family protein [Vallitalea okinawensis]
MINRNFIPFPELETERLILRETQSKDVTQLFKILSDPKVAQFEYYYPVKAKEEANEFIKRYRVELEEKEEITWGIILKSTDELVGICCLGDFNEGARRAEIGYDITQSEWGKGFATEAVGAIVDYGFNVMNLNRIEAAITPGNDASVKVLEKLDFTREGLLRERDLMKGKLEDGIIMAMLRREYKLLRD